VSEKGSILKVRYKFIREAMSNSQRKSYLTSATLVYVGGVIALFCLPIGWLVFAVLPPMGLYGSMWPTQLGWSLMIGLPFFFLILGMSMVSVFRRRCARIKDSVVNLEAKSKSEQTRGK
jgi:hypothetical protein